MVPTWVVLKRIDFRLAVAGLHNELLLEPSYLKFSFRAAYVHFMSVLDFDW